MTKKQKINRVDLSSLDLVAGSNDGADVDLYHPSTLDALGITVRVVGKDSDIYRAESNAIQRKNIAQMKKSRKIDLDLDEMEDAATSILASCTVSWVGVELDGKELECTRDNAMMVYERFPWIREQIDVAINDRANFMKG